MSFPLEEWALNLISEWLVTPITFRVLLYKWAFLARPQMDTTIEDFSSPILLLETFSTMKEAERYEVPTQYQSDFSVSYDSSMRCIQQHGLTVMVRRVGNSLWYLCVYDNSSTDTLNNGIIFIIKCYSINECMFLVTEALFTFLHQNLRAVVFLFTCLFRERISYAGQTATKKLTWIPMLKTLVNKR